MKITVFFSSKEHPIVPHLSRWKKENSTLHDIELTNNLNEVKDGDILFLIACGEIVKQDMRKRFGKTLCVHESNLPEGRGWSPAVYSVLNNEKKIWMTLFEVEDAVDSGDIWEKISFDVQEHELANEINNKISVKTLELMDFAIKNHTDVKPIPQDHKNTTYLKRRNPDDSELDVNKTIAKQFNLMRICDEKRYPCFFHYKGHKYKVTLQKF